MAVSRETPSRIWCPECAGTRVMVSQVWVANGTVTRRRRCQECDFRWTTSEIAVERLHELERAQRQLHQLRDIVQAVDRVEPAG